MRFAVASDTHNEFYFGREEIPRLPKTDAEVLILAGDIQTVKSHDVDWWRDISEGYEEVLYIPGNHEYYRSYFNEYPVLEFPDNVHFLGYRTNNALISCMGHSVLLGTMWSDISDPHADAVTKQLMNDYRYIKYSRERWWFNPSDTTKEYMAFIEAVDRYRGMLDAVITHHAPSYQSIHPNFKGPNVLNSAYYSNVDVTGIPLWIHGHTHHPVDYMQEGCRIVSNPAGYPGEIAGDFNMKVVQVGR